MAKRNGSATQGLDTGWMNGREPTVDAVWAEHGRNIDGSDGLVHVRHPGHEWLATATPGADLDAQAQAAALGYLEALCGLVPELDPVIESLAEPQGPLGWLRIGWGLQPGTPPDVNPNTSFVLARGGRATLVLLAARRLNGKAVGDAVGLKVTAHIDAFDRASSAPWRLRFTSVACSRIGQVGVPLPPAWSGVDRDRIHAALTGALPIQYAAVHSMHGTSDPDVCSVMGIGIKVRPRVASDPPRHKPRATVLAFEAAIRLTTMEVQVRRFGEVSSRMEGLFERDPASMGPSQTLDQRRPCQSEERLDPLREQTLRPRRTMAATAVELKDSDGLYFVTHERRSDTDAPDERRVNDPLSRTALLPPAPRAAAARWLPLRSDDLAAAQAYVRAQQLFDRLRAYGFEPLHYFRHAGLPLELRPRAWLRGAPDGHAVNAEVRPYFRQSTPEVDLLTEETKSRFAPGQRPLLLVRLGSADICVHAGAQTLGLAADPRWVWHEFGHVLNFAATGELEFAFAHSAGDALAAIIADPDSLLASDDRLRGDTFPWAFVPRRHDRSADQGYCWCGRRNQLRLRGEPRFTNHSNGYFEEEVLSSSLFRLYLAIGGATGTLPAEPPTEDEKRDLAIRRSASDYCVYLIVHAIGLLGPNGVVPSAGAGAFVGALIDADIGTTGQWKITAPWPYREGGSRDVVRQGGRVHKVIRWAFEQQGLYAGVGLDDTFEGAGKPPPVDVYIEDRRGGAPGGYTPVPLRWDGSGTAAWHAAPSAVVFDAKSGRLTVRVGQRGKNTATDVRLRVWVAAAPRTTAQSASPAKVGKWGVVQAASTAVSGEFEAALPTRANRPLWVLACADADGDLANLGAGNVPPVDGDELVELVANDNNLALAYVG